MDSGEHGVDAAARCNDGDVGAGAAQVCDNDNLVRQLCARTGVVGENGSGGLVDELQDFNVGLFCRLLEDIFLRIRKVCGDRDNSGIDVLAQIIRGRGAEALEMACGDFVDGDGVGLVGFRVADGEGDAIFVLDGVGRLVAGRGVDGLEPADGQTWLAGGSAGGEAYSWPRKSRK